MNLSFLFANTKYSLYQISDIIIRKHFTRMYLITKRTSIQTWILELIRYETCLIQQLKDFILVQISQFIWLSNILALSVPEKVIPEMCTKYDVYVFITTAGMIPRLLDHSSLLVSFTQQLVLQNRNDLLDLCLQKVKVHVIIIV